jgi:hypothetical protein
MEDTKRQLGEIDRALLEIEQRQKSILATLQRLDRQDGETLDDVASILREQARNNLETSRLLNDLSTEVAGLSFRVSELEHWRRLFTSVKEVDWISEQRTEQSRLCYKAIKDGFNDAEFAEFIMNIPVDPADVSGDSISEKALWLVEYTRRKGNFWKMVSEGRKLRPHALWPVSTGSLGQAL